MASFMRFGYPFAWPWFAQHRSTAPVFSVRAILAVWCGPAVQDSLPACGGLFHIDEGSPHSVVKSDVKKVCCTSVGPSQPLPDPSSRKVVGRMVFESQDYSFSERVHRQRLTQDLTKAEKAQFMRCSMGSFTSHWLL